MSKVRITVAKRLSNPDLLARYGKKLPPQCQATNDGQVFVSEGFKMPEGFCPWAWADIQRDVAVLECGGNFGWVSEPGVGVSCCTDGFRPVVFLLERID